MATPPDDPTQALAEYRRGLMKADHAASQSFDKALMTLSAGALGLSLSFIKDIVRTPIPSSLPWLGWSWVLLTFTLLLTLVSFPASQQSLRTAMRQVDEGGPAGGAKLGGSWTTVTSLLNGLATVSLVVGLGLFIRFAFMNYEEASRVNTAPQQSWHKQECASANDSSSGHQRAAVSPIPAERPGKEGIHAATTAHAEAK